MTQPTIDAFRIHADDNVATLLGDAQASDLVIVRGDGEAVEVPAAQMVQAGHKLALRTIAKGGGIVKYGFPIGEATRSISAGEWVHLHNCRSLHDPASSELDLESGARNETRYA
jgi:altronate dehydratase small subunit